MGLNNMSIILRKFVERRNDRLISEITSRLTRLVHSGDKPVLIAINGKTAVGKTTLSRRLRERVISDDGGGSVSCAYLGTDSWLREGRSEREARGLTGLDVSAYDLDDLETVVRKLLNRESVVTPVYDHSEGVPAGSRSVEAADLIIIDGLMSTHPRLIEFLEEVYWIDCSEQNHKRFRIERNVRERGYSHEAAEANYEKHSRRWESWLDEMKPSQVITLRINRMRLMTLDRKGRASTS
jgi:uridine kinase